MAPERSLHLSHSFVLSCGTITIDFVDSKLLLIYWRIIGEYFLPKGRKDVGETFEETGHRVELLPPRIKTLATTPSVSYPEKTQNEGKDTPVTEPVAVQQRATKENTLKIIFCFAAKGCSTEALERKVQQESEEIDTGWASFEEGLKMLSFDDDTESVLRHANEYRRGNQV